MIRHFESYNLAQFEGLKANQEISFEKCFIFFFRLTPPYILTWLLYVGLFYYMGEGPLWPSVDPNLECRKYWWHNLLYINNILTPGKEVSQIYSCVMLNEVVC